MKGAPMTPLARRSRTPVLAGLLIAAAISSATADQLEGIVEFTDGDLAFVVAAGYAHYITDMHFECLI